MREEEFRIRLNTNKPVNIFGLKVRQLTLDEVMDDIGYDKFKQVRDFVNLDISSFSDEISSSIEEYMLDVKECLILNYPTTNYDMTYDLYDMCLHVPFIKTMFMDFIKTFTTCEDVIINHMEVVDEMTILYTQDERFESLTLNRQTFYEFMDLFSILNFTVRVDRDRVRDSESVKEFDRKANEIKKKYGFKSKQEVTLESITSALIDSDNPNYTHESIGGKTIYQIMNSFNRMCKIKDNEFMNLVRVNATKIDSNDVKANMWYYNLY